MAMIDEPDLRSEQQRAADLGFASVAEYRRWSDAGAPVLRCRACGRGVLWPDARCRECGGEVERVEI